MDQLFCLHWNDHQNTLISLLEKLLVNEQLIDVTLSAEGQTIGAHRVVLSACSQYFEKILFTCGDKHPVVILKDVKFEDLKCLLGYMYKGELNISQDKLTSLIKVAESLKIKGLTGQENGDNINSDGYVDNELEKSPAVTKGKARKRKRPIMQTDNSKSHVKNLFKCPPVNNYVSMPRSDEMQQQEALCNVQQRGTNLFEQVHIKEENVECNDGYGNYMSSDCHNSPNDTYYPQDDQYNYSCPANWSQETINGGLVSGPPSNLESVRPGLSENAASEKIFVCPKCSRGYKFKKSLFRHLKEECGLEPRYTCQLCPKRFRRRESLTHHLRLHGVNLSENECVDTRRVPGALAEPGHMLPGDQAS